MILFIYHYADPPQAKSLYVGWVTLTHPCRPKCPKCSHGQQIRFMVTSPGFHIPNRCSIASGMPPFQIEKGGPSSARPLNVLCGFFDRFCSFRHFKDCTHRTVFICSATPLADALRLQPAGFTAILDICPRRDKGRAAVCADTFPAPLLRRLLPVKL